MRFLSVIIVCTLLTATQIRAQSLASRISRTDLDNSIQIFIYFDQIPDFKQQLSNKRLDVSFADTDFSESIEPIPTDDIIVKTLIISNDARDSQGSGPSGPTLSFFFRYIPQEVKVSAEEANTLVIDIIPGNRFTAIYKDLANDLGTLLVVNRSEPYPPNPLVTSPFADNWQTFFTAYRSLAAINPSLSMYFPPFPWIGMIEHSITDPKNYPAELIENLYAKDWFSALTDIQRALVSSPRDGLEKYLVLLHAEILFRLGNMDAAIAQLNLLTHTYPDESIGILSQYLYYLIEAQKGSHHLAAVGLRQLQKSVGPDHPVTPYLTLSLFENSLALKQVEDQSELVPEVLLVNEELQQRFEIRTADALRIQAEYEQALHHYDAVGADILSQLPFSYHGYCEALLHNGYDKLSSTCFLQLSELFVKDGEKAAALYKAATIYSSELAESSMEALLDRIISTYPHTESAARASLMKADLCINRDISCMEHAGQVYEQVSHRAIDREFSSEAHFKKSLVYHLSGDDSTCLDELMILLREYRTAHIRQHASALLVQLLPGYVAALLDSGNDRAAITLVQQNRWLFDNRWIDLSFLSALSPALERLGLYREAIALNLFLSNEDEQADEQEIYWNLTRLAHLQGNVDLVEDFSSNYFHNFPAGRFYEDVLFYRLDAMYGSGLIDQAELLLPEPLPERFDFSFLAASIYFQQGAYDKTAAILGPLPKGLLPDNQIFIAAESLYELGRYDEAEFYYLLLEDIPSFRGPALYRISVIAEKRNDSEIGIYQLRQLAGMNDGNRWQKLAEQQLRYIGLMKML